MSGSSNARPRLRSFSIHHIAIQHSSIHSRPSSVPRSNPPSSSLIGSAHRPFHPGPLPQRGNTKRGKPTSHYPPPAPHPRRNQHQISKCRLPSSNSSNPSASRRQRPWPLISVEAMALSLPAQAPEACAPRILRRHHVHLQDIRLSLSFQWLMF